MSNPRFILFPSATTWRFRAIDSPQSPLIEVLVEANSTRADIAIALQKAGCTGEVLLAIPSNWCLCAPVSTAGLPAKNREQALAYRLEDQLPIAAEDLVADFLPVTSSDDQTLGVCVQKGELAPIIEDLESNGISVATICPAAMLSLQSVIEHTVADAVVWASDQPGMLELFILRNRQPRAWYVLPDTPADLLQHLLVECRGSQTSIVSINLRLEIVSAVSNHPGVKWAALDSTDPATAAASIAGSILSGKTKPWIDLGRGDLAATQPFRHIRTPLTIAAAAIAIFLVTLCGAMLWRANQFDQMAATAAEKQQSVFRQIFPNDPMPVDVRSRLAAQQRGLHGLVGDSTSPPPQENGLVMLRDLLLHLPTADQLRYRVLELRLDSTRFTLEGQTAAHGDADRIVESLRHDSTFTVEAPRTEQLGSSDSLETADKPKGVSFTITGAVPQIERAK